MTKIYVVRHGDILNPDDVVYLRMDKEIQLSSLGNRQIQLQAEKLSNKNIKAIYHSPLFRTKQTGEILESVLKTNKITADNRLVDSGSPAQGVQMEDFDQQYQGNLYHPALLANGGETLEQIKDRMISAVKDFSGQNPDKSIVVVSHGDPIKVLWLIADKLDLNKNNLGSDRQPVSGIIYPIKGSVTVFEYGNEELERTDYWEPIL